MVFKVYYTISVVLLHLTALRQNEQVCRSSLLSGRNLCWPRRMLPPGESRWVADWTDGRTDGRQTVTLHYPLDAASVKIVRRCC